MGTAVDAAGGRVCQRRAGLLLATDTIATMGDERCYMELAVLLPAATEVATMGDGRRYMELAALLRMAAGLATMGDGAATWSLRRCCRRPPELLPWAAGLATMGDGRCYMELAALLPAVTGVATMAYRCCYRRAPELLQASPSCCFISNARVRFSSDCRCRRRSNAGVHAWGRQSAGEEGCCTDDQTAAGNATTGFSGDGTMGLSGDVVTEDHGRRCCRCMLRESCKDVTVSSYPWVAYFFLVFAGKVDPG
jgi:hypothetical protein